VTQAAAALSRDGGADAAEAIRTTDTVAKTAVASAEGWSVGGMAKGAAMLAPALATMLAVVTTDAVADASVLDEVLRAATARSFDRVDTDGCMSTNDTVLLLASGASGVEPSRAELQSAVSAVCHDLAQQMVRDAEGASKDIAVEVVGAAGVEDALEVARAVGRSNLLKCALHGNDPNWGRVLAAVGTTAAAFEPDELDVGDQRRAGVPGRRGGRARDAST
jgi:glutamate N-acetyltransferase/amino-acid N-acetyltransferase